MERRAILASITFWGVYLVSCQAMDEKDVPKDELKLTETITYDSIKEACLTMNDMITSKNMYIYKSLLMNQEIPLRQLSNFCNKAIDRLEKEAVNNKVLEQCLEGLEKSCQKKQKEVLKDNTEKKTNLGLRGSKIIYSKDAPVKGMTYYRSREGVLKDTLDLKTILNLPENAPTGKGITIGLYEKGIDIDHYTVEECVKRSHKSQCTVNYLKDEHGTAVGSVLAAIAPQSAIHLITSTSLEELKSPHEMIEKMFSTSIKNCKENILFDCLNTEENKQLINKLMNLANNAIQDSKIINVSYGFLDNKMDDHFTDTSTGMPFVLNLLANDANKLIVKAAGNDSTPVIGALKDFVKNETSGRMILVASLTYTEDGETIASSHSNYATSNEDILICAPGENILVGLANSEQNHSTEKGTSLATPIVSATLALLMEKYPQWQETPEKYISILLESARRETLDGKDANERQENYNKRIGTKCGHGILDIPAALKLAQDSANQVIDEN